MNIFIRISRHSDERRESLIREIFGNDVRIVTEDLVYGSNPVDTFRNFVAEVGYRFTPELTASDDSVEVIGVELSGPQPAVIAIVKSFGSTIALVRPVFRRDGDRVAVIGKDDNGRDLFDIVGYEALGVEVKESVVPLPLAAVWPRMPPVQGGIN